MSPFCSWDDVAYGIYKTVGIIASDSEYRSDVYANALGNVLSNTTSYEENILLVLGTYMSYPFWCYDITADIPRFVLWLMMHV